MTPDLKAVSRKLRGLLLVIFLALVAFPGQDVEALEEPKELLFGIEPEHNIFDQVERYRLLADYLSQELGIKVRLTILSRYGEVLKRFKARRLDGVFLSSYTATIALQELNLKPVARPVDLNGNSSCLGYVFARKDSGIKSIHDMKGKSIAFVDPATTEGYLYLVAMLYTKGIRDKDTFFSYYSFVGSHASAIFAVLDGKAEIGCAKNTVYNKLIAKDPSINAELSIIAESPVFPETTLCVKKDIPEEVQKKIAAVLLNMAATEGGRAVLRKMELLSFGAASETDFEDTLSMINMVGKP